MRRVGLILIIVLTLAAAPAGAQRLLGTVGVGGGATSTLVELDPATGAQVATIGAVGYLVNGMAWDYTTGTLYATTSTRDVSFPSGLLTINPATGAGTPIGTGFGLGSGTCVLTAVNSAGQVYSWWDPGPDDLLIFDTVTGLATMVGEAGLSTATHSISFDASDVLYLVNYGGTVYTVDTTTGATTNVGDIGQIAHHGQFNPTTGLLWGIDSSGVGSKNLVIADLTTFAVDYTLPTVDDLHTLAWVEGEFVRPGIPAVSPWGAGLMALLVLACGALVLRRYV